MNCMRIFVDASANKPLNKSTEDRRRAEAEKWFAELWASGNFNCGPEDYVFMVKRCIQPFDRIDELEDATDLTRSGSTSE
jgi:hypothetical protein